MPTLSMGSKTSLSAMVLSTLLASAGCELISTPDRSRIPGEPDSTVDAAEPTPKSDGGVDPVKDSGTSDMGLRDGAAMSADSAAIADVGGHGDVAGADALATAPGKIIYLTNMPKKANFGGVAGADALCNASPPVPGTYRALIADGVTRALGTNWALAPDTKYVRADGSTVIGTTNGNAAFVFPLNAGMGTSGVAIWTGLNADWSSSDDDCNNWSGTAGFSATAGLADTTDSQAIMGVLENCATLAGAFFACVEQ